LKQAAQAPRAAEDSKSTPAAGVVRAIPDAKPGDADEQQTKDEKSNSVPQIVDVESSQQPSKPDEDQESDDETKSPAGSRLTLPTTTMLGGAKKGEACPAGEKVDQAVQQQEDLLAEFEKIA